MRTARKQTRGRKWEGEEGRSGKQACAPPPTHPHAHAPPSPRAHLPKHSPLTPTHPHPPAGMLTSRGAGAGCPLASCPICTLRVVPRTASCRAKPHPGATTVRRALQIAVMVNGPTSRGLKNCEWRSCQRHAAVMSHHLVACPFSLYSTLPHPTHTPPPIRATPATYTPPPRTMKEMRMGCIARRPKSCPKTGSRLNSCSKMSCALPPPNPNPKPPCATQKTKTTHGCLWS